MLSMSPMRLGRFRRCLAMTSVIALGAAGLLVGNRATATAASYLTVGSGTAANCPDGFTAAQEQSSTPISGGGAVDRYVVDGTDMDVPVAPSTFAPLNATDAELAVFGLPPRPVGSASLASWTSLMRAWRPTPDAGLCVGPNGLTFSSHVNGTWSGKVVDVWASVIAVTGIAWASLSL